MNFIVAASILVFSVVVTKKTSCFPGRVTFLISNYPYLFYASRCIDTIRDTMFYTYPRLMTPGHRRRSALFGPFFRGRIFLRLPPGAMEVSFSLGNQRRDVPTSHV